MSSRIRTPKARHPSSVGIALDAFLKTLGTQQLDERSGNEWRHDFESLIRLQFLHRAPDNGKRLASSGDEFAHVDTFESERSHESGSIPAAAAFALTGVKPAAECSMSSGAVNVRLEFQWV